MRILIVEDEIDLAQAILANLKRTYIVDVATTGENACFKANTNNYDLIILDLGLPDINGLKVCQELRADQVTTPILILSGYSQIPDKICGFDSGADDYLSKPFSLLELEAHIRALLRREKQLCFKQITINNLCLNLSAKTVSYQHQTIKLNHKEFMLLELLMRHPRQIVNKSMIIDHVWEQTAEICTNTVEVHINRLRKKIDKRFKLNLIKTVYGMGYRFG